MTEVVWLDAAAHWAARGEFREKKEKQKKEKNSQFEQNASIFTCLLMVTETAQSSKVAKSGS